MRKGFTDDSGEEAVRMAQVAEASGISMVCVHGRTQSQGYGGTADWRAIRRVKDAVKIPVIGNGDIFKAADAKRMVDETGCDGVMIGRGGLGNPWIYTQIRSLLYDHLPDTLPTVQERLATVLAHLKWEVEFIGEKKAVFHMRRIGAWYLAGRPRAAFYRDSLNKAQTALEIEKILTTSFQDDVPESFHVQTAA
jgi:tRNA-dihydrouridine synthase B